jgi:light-harvesting complex 1 beta chain
MAQHAIASASTGASPHRPAGDTVAFQAIFAVAFVLLLCVALVAQLLTLQWRSWLPGAENERSLPGAVRSAVYTFMPLLS